jgi:thioredoxin-like negative regulator of GroEL
MLTLDTIDNETQRDGFILIGFVSDNCRESKKLKMTLSKINYPTYTINVDKDPDIVEDYSIETIPSLIIFFNGQNIHTIAGFKTKTFILKIMGNCKN